MQTCDDCIKIATSPNFPTGGYSVKVIGALVHLTKSGEPVCKARGA